MPEVRAKWTTETVFEHIREYGFPGTEKLRRMLQDIWNDGYDTGNEEAMNDAD